MAKRILIAGTGGGMKGYSQCAVFAEIERRVGKPISAFCSLYGGTSVAAIVGLSLAAGNSAQDTLGFFTVDGPVIFDKTILTDTFDLLKGDRYSGAVIEQKLQARIGRGLMSQAKMQILVSATDLATSRAFFFKSYDPNTALYPMWQAARASSAAQDYFPAFVLESHYFWDGGNSANNPAACVYADAINLWGEEEDFVMLSVGCGAPPVNPDPRKTANGNALEIAAETLDLQMAANASVVDYQMKQILGDRFFQIQPVVTTALDDASPAALRADEESAALCIASYSAVIDEFCNHCRDALALSRVAAHQAGKIDILK